MIVALLALAPIAVPAAALADGDEETDVGYVLVQQALGHLAHDDGPDGVDPALEKVDDALATEHQEGVDVALVEQGRAALEAGQVEQARTLLQESIAEALTGRPLATGYETGTGAVPAALAGRDGLHAADWLVLVLSALVAGVGIWLSVRYRPDDSVAGLRRRLGPPGGRDDQEGRPR